jgi:ElaB/YqjD/DUF883 family membrane-anchored ribosome-binding protein
LPRLRFGSDCSKTMELYFKELISADATLEKLVDDLSLVVHGVDDLAKVVGAKLSEQTREEVAGRLERLKARCQSLREQTLAGMRRTDRFLRRNPYPFIGAAFGLGLLVGLRMGGGRDRESTRL